MLTSIFSTLIAVSAGFPTHVLLKTPLVMLVGFQLLNTSVEKSVREVLLRHALLTSAPVGNGVLNEVSPLDRHASENPTPVLLVPRLISDGNDVREVQDLHAPLKNLPLPRSKAGKELSVVSRHVSVN